MANSASTPTIKNLDLRLSTVEQILPTLATKEDLRLATLATKEELDAAIAKAVEPLATKEELRRAIEPLATKEFVKADGEATRRHFDVVAESLRTDIRLIAEGQVHLTQRLGTFEAKTETAITKLDRRVMRLEADRRR